VTLQGVSALSADQFWKPGFIHETTGVLHKVFFSPFFFFHCFSLSNQFFLQLVNLDSLAVYWNTHVTPLSKLTQEQFLDEATKMVFILIQ